MFSYVCSLTIDGSLRYVLWYTNDTDGLVREGPGAIASFASDERARAHAAQMSLDLAAEPAVHYDFDRLAEVLARVPRGSSECKYLIDLWNLLDDAVEAGDDEGRFQEASRAPSVTYEKLFWACNLEPMTPPGKSFTPE